MRIKVRNLIILLISVLVSLAVACNSVQRNTNTMSEPKNVIIDVEQVGFKIGVELKDENHVNSVYRQKWNKRDIINALAELSVYFNEPENTYFVTNSPREWVTLALIEGLQPLNVLYLYPRADGVALDMCELKRVEQLPRYNHDVVFEIVEEGDEIFINLNSDRPEAHELGYHTFETANLCKVVIPEIPFGKHVFVHGKGSYSVMVAVARSYIKGSKSVSMSSHDYDYVCSVSNSDEREVGDVRILTLPNNL